MAYMAYITSQRFKPCMGCMTVTTNTFFCKAQTLQVAHILHPYVFPVYQGAMINFLKQRCSAVNSNSHPNAELARRKLLTGLEEPVLQRFCTLPMQ